MEDVLVVRAATCWRETAGALTFFFEPQAGAFSKFLGFMTNSTLAKIFHLASHLRALRLLNHRQTHSVTSQRRSENSSHLCIALELCEARARIEHRNHGSSCQYQSFGKEEACCSTP
jgi:hypothetical protein